MNEREIWQERFERWAENKVNDIFSDQLEALVVTEWFKPIFGDLLKSAATFSDDSGPNRAQREQKNVIKTMHEMFVDGYPVFLEFFDGRIVKFWVSEWGGIEPVEK